MKISIISILLFLFFWEILVSIFQIEQWILPSPLAIANSFINSIDLFITHSGRTLLESIMGLLIGTIFGFIIALLMELSKVARKIIYPFIFLTQTIPFITVAPLFVIWFGYGLTAKVIIISLVCFFPIALSLEEGLRSTDRNMVRLIKSMGAGKWNIYWYVRIPASLPYFFSGLRIAASYAVLSAVISEWIGSDRGLGILLIRSSKSYLTDRVFAVIFLISVLTLILVKIIDLISINLLPWYYQNFKKKENYV